MTRALLEWSFDPMYTPAKTRPTVYVWNGNGAYHTSIEGLKTNASGWGYDIFASTFWVDIILEMTDILVLNSQDFLTDYDVWVIEHWWNTGNRTLWVVGDSDYGGYWYPTDLNELIVNLGGHIIMVDDAISDPVSNDGASYRVVCNVTNDDSAWDTLLRTPYTPDIVNTSFHGPTYVAPWTGTISGNKTLEPAAMVEWDDLQYADWIINTSIYAQVQDQDGDDDDVWEDNVPLSNGSVAMLAVEDNLGPWTDSKLVVAGEAFFSDYKEMFGYIQRYANGSNQNINLTRALLDWSTPTNMRYYQIADDMYAPTIEITGDNTHEVSDADYVADNEEFEVSFVVHDYPNAYTGIAEIFLTYEENNTETNVSLTQEGFNGFKATFGPFDYGTDVSYYIYVRDQAGFWAMSETQSFSVDYSDTLAPNATVTLMKGFETITSTSTVYTTEAVNVVVTTPDIAEEDEVISGFDSITIEYSTDGTTWTEAIVAGSGTSYTATLAGFDADTTVQVRVTVKDKAGNSKTIDAGSYTVTAAPIVTTTTTTRPAPGFEILFGFLALMGLALFVSRRRKR